MSQTEADVLIEGKVLKFTNAKPNCQEMPIAQIHTLSSQEATNCFFQRKVLGWAWGKVYRQQVKRFLHFPEEIRMWEDSLAIHCVLKHKLKWCIMPENSHYGYRQHNESACANFTPQKRLDTLVVLRSIMDIYQSLGYSPQQLKDYWLLGNSAYYTQGPEDCYNKLSASEKKIFEQEVSAITKLTGAFPYDVFMWLRLHLLHGKLGIIPRTLEYLFYGIQKRIASQFGRQT